MPWRYEVRLEPREGFQRPLPKFILTNGVDTDIICYTGRDIIFLYSRPDLSFRMSGSRDLRDVPRSEWPKTDLDLCLGPTCRLYLEERSLSRELTADDYPRIAADFKAALALYLEVPASKPPAIEKVTFYNDFLAPYSDR
jgi:hypothetical protein